MTPEIGCKLWATTYKGNVIHGIVKHVDKDLITVGDLDQICLSGTIVPPKNAVMTVKIKDIDMLCVWTVENEG